MYSEIAIHVDSLRKTYRSGLFGRKSFEALRGISFDVRRGEIFGLLGPNGAGKTTFIKVLLGILRKSGGNASVLGHAAGDRAGRIGVGYLPENLRIPRHHTAQSALAFYGNLSGQSSRSTSQRRGELLETVGLGDWEKVRIKKFSKGMLQRLGLAQAMLHDPELLILDEPTDGLDPVGRNSVREILLQLKSQGKTVFVNSHLLQEVELFCDQVAILNHGNLQFVGSVDQVRHRGQTTSVELELAGPESEVRAAMDLYANSKWQTLADGRFHVTLLLEDQTAIDQCVDGLREHGVSIARLSPHKATLEDAFLDIVGAEVVEPESK